MGFPRPDRRFSDAKSVEQLARMLDDWLIKLALYLPFKYEQAFVPRMARSPEGLQIGTLVQIAANGLLRRASRLDTAAAPVILMDGVVIDVLGNSAYVWANKAQLELSVADFTGAIPSPLYLSNVGTVQNTRPASGWIQPVGMVIGLNGQTGKYLCALEPFTATNIGA